MILIVKIEYGYGKETMDEKKLEEIKEAIKKEIERLSYEQESPLGGIKFPGLEYEIMRIS